MQRAVRSRRSNLNSDLCEIPLVSLYLNTSTVEEHANTRGNPGSIPGSGSDLAMLLPLA
jgi:hypothetical protein